MVTNGCHLNSKWVIHTASPQAVKEEDYYKPSKHTYKYYKKFSKVELGYHKMLEATIWNALYAAKNLKVRSVAIPTISIDKP